MPGISVNGIMISNDLIRAETARLRAEMEAGGRELSFEERIQVRKEATGRLVERLLVGQEAERIGLIPTDAEVQETLAALVPRLDGVSGCRAGMDSVDNVEEIRRRMSVDKIIAFWLKDVKEPAGGEVRNFYQANRDRFYLPEMVHAAHILKPTHHEAEQLRARVAAGEDFAAVAAEASDCKDDAGDLGYFPRGTMVEEFDAVVFATPAGELTPVFETPFGFHTVLVIDRKPEGVRSLADATKEIKSILLRVKQEKAVEDKLAQLHKRAVIREVAHV